MWASADVWDVPNPLPDLDPGLTLLSPPGPRSTALHRLVVDALGDTAGPAYWVDARNAASTYALYDLAPSERRLAGLRVARAFTAYQHHELVRALPRRADRETGLVVAPNVAALYADDDVPDWEQRDLLASAVAVLAELGTALDVPVLTTAPGAPDALAAVVADAADVDLDCTRTGQGFRYEGDGFETRAYRVDGCWQTTIPYWVALCGSRPAVERPDAHGPARGDPAWPADATRGPGTTRPSPEVTGG